MASDRKRLLELALDSLETKKRKINDEMAVIVKELGLEAGAKVKSAAAAAVRTPKSRRKTPQFSKAERLKRSQRMKAYWEKWRKEKAKTSAK